MIANINPRGTSFKGVTAYLMHDKKAQTSERVGWTETRNIITDDIDTASKIMAYTDMNSDSLKQALKEQDEAKYNKDFSGRLAGAKREAGAVYHFSLSEDPKNQPTQEEWAAYVDKNIEKLGLNEHQYFMVAHNDEEHVHVHVVVNLVHPETGKINSLHNDYKKMDKLAHEYELKNGIVCEERNKKYEAWAQEKKAFKEKENREAYSLKVTNAFKQSDNGKSFKNALEHEGLTLSQGSRRGFVLVDTQGEIFALNRLIKFDDNLRRKEKSSAINAKLKGIDKQSLPLAENLRQERQTFDRDAQELQQQKSLAKASEGVAENKAKQQIEQEKKQAKTKARAAVLEVIKQLAEEKENEFFKQQKIAKYEKYLAGKINASREKWDIDELTNTRDKAKEQLQKNSGFIARMTGKKRVATERLEAQQKTLDERLGRFETDIVYYNRNRPQWVINKELKKQGFEPQKIDTKTRDKAEQIKKETVQAKEAFNPKNLSEDQRRVVTASPSQIEKNIKAQKAHNQSISTASFMDGLSEEQKAQIEAYKTSNPEQDNEKKRQKQDQSHKPELE